MEEPAEFCENCGEKVNIENVDSDNQGRKTKNKQSKIGIIVGAIVFIIVVAGALGYFVIYPQVTQYMQEQENQEKADKVSNLINSVTSGEITLDSEKDLDSAKMEYNSLTDNQKALVDNYDKLEEAYAALDSLKVEQENQEKAQSIIDAIEAIDPESLTDSDTFVQSIREQYDSLTDEQKKLVTNADKLIEFENIVQQKKDQKVEEEERQQALQAQSDEIVAMFNNLTTFEGGWDEFGAHNNKYQGMVESAINSSITLSNYFANVDEIYMSLRKVIDNDDALMNGATATNQHYLIRFEGVNPNTTGPYRTLECRVDSPDGVNLVYTEQLYY